MKLLIIILLIPFLALSQDKFKPGYYKQGSIVIDANGVKWKAKANVNAKGSPRSGAYWELVKAPALSLDSLERRINRLERETIFILKIAQQGYSILNVKGDKSGAWLRTIVLDKGLKVKQTDSTLILSIEK